MEYERNTAPLRRCIFLLGADLGPAGIFQKQFPLQIWALVFEDKSEPFIKHACLHSNGLAKLLFLAGHVLRKQGVP